jgi:hypothetical protein
MASPLTKLCYHLTTYNAAKSIIDAGFIDPAFSQGRQKVNWYVSSRLISWAIPHVCQRHEAELEQIVIFTVKTPATDMRRSNKRGIYYCGEKIPIIEMSSAAIWLQREERAVFVPGGQRRRSNGYRW